jgi:hypothetical protein
MSSTSVTESTNETNDSTTRTMDNIVLEMFREYFNSTDSIDNADGEFWTSIMSNQSLSLAFLTNDANITTTTNVLEKILQTTPSKSLDILKASKDDNAKLTPSLAVNSADISLEMLPMAMMEMSVEDNFIRANNAAIDSVKKLLLIDQPDDTDSGGLLGLLNSAVSAVNDILFDDQTVRNAAEDLINLLSTMDIQWGVKSVVHVADAIVQLRNEKKSESIKALSPNGVLLFEEWLQADISDKDDILANLTVSLAAILYTQLTPTTNLNILSSTIISEQGEKFEKAVAIVPSDTIVAGTLLALKKHLADAEENNEDQKHDKENIRIQSYVNNNILQLLDVIT